MASAEVLMAGGVQLDPARLATFLSVSGEDIRSLASITEAYIASILQAVVAKANEFDELKADKLRVEVELEQSVRTADSRVKSMKGQLDLALAETQELRMKASRIESARAALENELATYKTSRTSVDEEARLLRVRVQTLESDKRDTVETLDRKCSEYDKLQEEYTAAQHKNIATRREMNALETRVQQAESAQSTAKFRAQSLEQEAEMLKKNNEWLDNELRTKTQEHQKFRKEKAAQVSSLNSELDEALSTVEMTKRSLDNVKERYEEVSRKAEERLAKIREVQNESVTQEENFRKEIGSQQRLAELYEQSMKNAKARVAELEELLDQEREQQNVELGQAHAETETERSDKEAAERRIAELEADLERLEGELVSVAAGVVATSHAGSPNGTATPVRRPGSRSGSAVGRVGTPGIGTPGSVYSPIATSRLQKSGVSITQLYSDYTQVKALFETERRRNAKLEEAMAELMQDLEQKGPEVQELREEHDRLEKELLDMSKLLEDTAKERDQARKESRKMQGNIGDSERETAILRQQLRDLSTQIQVLLVEIEQRDAGIEQLSAHQNRIFEEIVNGNLTIEGQNDTDQLITQRLTVFRNLQEMQEQNRNLLKAIRELGTKMEKEEQERLKDQQVLESEEVARLQGAIERMKDECRTIAMKSRTFVKERDMFRRMLQNKGELHAEGVSPPPASDAGSVAISEMQNNIGELLKSVQSQYDQFKTEAIETQNTISEQNRRLSGEKSELEVQLARINSQLEMASERYDMLNGNFNMLKSENQELQKRLTSMHETQARLDLKAQQAAEELVDSKSLLESMRTENANLKAEKAFFKNVEQRMAQDNEALTQDRARLNTLVANLQSMQSEHERNSSEARRSYLAQSEQHRADLQAVERRLNEEVEQSKRSFIRKEMDQKEFQRRYDELNTSYQTVKEELVAVKTSQDHLQTRVNELIIDLKNAEEKLAVYQDKPSAPATNQDEEDASIEEELRLEVIDLKKQLEVRNTELANSKEQAKYYKAISMANEEHLEDLQVTADQFRESMEQELEQREITIHNLELRLQDMSTELASTNQELSRLRQSELDKVQDFESQKSILESQLDNLKGDIEKANAAAQFHQEDLKRQAGIAQEAQQNYERELVKHADAARGLQQLRIEYADLKTQIHGVKTEAETAKAVLRVNKSSWDTRQENYEKELKDVRARCDDLAKQNKILLGQFESVSDQIATLQRARAEQDEAASAPLEGQTLDKSMDDLRELVLYLKQEKEIVDAQYELSKLEAKRLKQLFDHTSNQLGEVRVQLNAEQQRQADQLRGATEHKELMEKISELNLLRESNSTLRFDSERKGRKVTELSTKIEELEAKIQPLEQLVRELEAEKEVKDAQMKLLCEDNERWKARTQQILQKYDRVDPAELEELKQKAAAVEMERDESQKELEVLQNKLQTAGSEKDTQLQEQANQWRGKILKLRDEANGKISNMRTKQQELTQEIDSLRLQVDEASKQKEQIVSSDSEELQRVQQEKERLEAAIKALEERVMAAEAQASTHRSQAQQLYKELGQLKQEKNETTSEIESLKSQLENIKGELEGVKANERALTDKLAAQRSGLPAPEMGSIASIEAEVRKRVAGLQPQLPQLETPTCNHEEEIQAEVQRRVAEIEASIQANAEAEVQRRFTEFQQSVDKTEEGEVADIALPISAPSELDPAQAATAVSQLPEEEIAARVNAEVEARMVEHATRVAEKERVIEERIKNAQSKFQEYKSAAVKKAVEDLEAKHKSQDEAYQNRISELEAELAKLRSEIIQLEATIADLEARPAAGVQEVGIKQEDLEAALQAKEKEHQAAYAELRAGQTGGFEEAKERLRMEIQAELLAIQANVEGAADAATEGGAQVNREKEKLKAVISRNVEHRLGKEKERWLQDITAEREKTIQERVLTVLEEKLAERETEFLQKESHLKAELEKSKDAIRQEGVMRSKVQLNMLERKNKVLEDKLKAAEGPQPQGSPTPTATSQPAQPQLQQTGLRRPSQISAHQQPNGQALPMQQTPAQIAAAQQAAINAAEQATASQIPQQQRRGENQGTGPGTLRQLRGALGGTSGIPRGGMAGRGRGGNQQSGPQSASPPAAQHLPTGILNPFASVPLQAGSTIPNPFAGGQQQQQGARGGGPPRGRGTYRGRGQVNTGVSNAGQGAGSPTRGGMNPGARQFVPGGNKRGREGGEGEEQTEGKRIRSSGGPVSGQLQG